ncbi:MAG TPA: hypothetical protein VJU61_23520, partial [Polyangiaceae bacterium]|nr:hypothetical protein [Polyangiaceae bacterium]
PEQLRGSREIDHRADLWSLSAIACECLTGRRPFEASDFAQLALLLLGNTGRPLPSALGPVPAGFDAWFLRATHPDITQRFQSARELGRALAAVCGLTPGAVIGETLLPTQEFASEPPSTAPVAHSRALWYSPSSLWQLPSVRLVVPTFLALLLVGGAFGAWYRLRFRPAERAAAALAAPATAPATETLALTRAEAPAGGPPAAPASSGEPAPIGVAAPAISAPAEALPTAQLPGTASAAPSPAPVEATASPAVQRAPWAVKQSAKSKPAVRRAKKTSEGNARAQASPPAEAEPDAPTVDINGRRIRMTLEPTR